MKDIFKKEKSNKDTQKSTTFFDNIIGQKETTVIINWSRFNSDHVSFRIWYHKNQNTTSKIIKYYFNKKSELYEYLIGDNTKISNLAVYDYKENVFAQIPLNKCFITIIESEDNSDIYLLSVHFFQEQFLKYDLTKSNEFGVYMMSFF